MVPNWRGQIAAAEAHLGWAWPPTGCAGQQPVLAVLVRRHGAEEGPQHVQHQHPVSEGRPRLRAIQGACHISGWHRGFPAKWPCPQCTEQTLASRYRLLCGYRSVIHKIRLIIFTPKEMDENMRKKLELYFLFFISQFLSPGAFSNTVFLNNQPFYILY